MANVRDPAFWRRFSMAVHMDEEAAKSGTVELKHSDSWLARQNQKKSRRTCICWAFWLCIFALVAAIVIVILWLKTQGMLGGSGGSSSADATPTATHSVALATKTISSTTAPATATATSTLAAKRS